MHKNKSPDVGLDILSREVDVCVAQIASYLVASEVERAQDDLLASDTRAFTALTADLPEPSLLTRARWMWVDGARKNNEMIAEGKYIPPGY